MDEQHDEVRKIMEKIDPQYRAEVLVKARQVLTEAQFKYYECHIRGMSKSEMCKRFERSLSAVNRGLKIALQIVHREYGKRGR